MQTFQVRDYFESEITWMIRFCLSRVTELSSLEFEILEYYFKAQIYLTVN